MREAVKVFLHNGALAVATLFGPFLWGSAFLTIDAALRLGVDVFGLLLSAGLSFFAVVWALWGLIGGPRHLRRWWFLIVTIVNMFTGASTWDVATPGPSPMGYLFLAQSLWAFVVFRHSKASG